MGNGSSSIGGSSRRPPGWRPLTQCSRCGPTRRPCTRAPISVTITATDMESDPITYHASSGDGSSELPDGMTFSGQTLSWSPSVAGTRYVKFWVTTESGGTDAIIAEFVVTGHGGCPFV